MLEFLKNVKPNFNITDIPLKTERLKLDNKSHYENTAIMMQNRIIEELKLKNSKISKISNTNFRVYLGPFNNLKSLKNAFDDITPLNFENIEIIKL